MKNLFLLVFAFIYAPLCLVAQTSYTVTAKSGLNLRTEPGMTGKKVASIPFGAIVISEDDVTQGVKDTIEDKPGSWIKIQYQARSGYVFTGFLAMGEQVVQATEINRDYRLLKPGFLCSPANFDPGLNWYALVRKDGRLTVKKTNIVVKFREDFSEKDLAAAECADCYACKVEASIEDSVFFYIGAKQPLVEGNRFSKFLGDYWNYDGGAKFFYPEQTFQEYYAPYNYTFRAFEGVMLTVQPPGYQKKYQLEYDMYIHGNPMKTFDLSQDLNLSSTARQHSVYQTPQLIWIGDLNLDGLLDFIWYSHTMTDSCGVCWEYHLFMSDKNDPEQPIKKVADHVECNCLT